MNEALILQHISPDHLDAIAAAFYAQIPADDLLGPMYLHHDPDLAAAERRFALFLRMRIAADATYLEERGHPRLRGRHMPFTIDSAARDRWLEIMQRALTATNTPAEAIAELMLFFTQVADFMRNTPDSDGCPAHKNPDLR